MITHSYKLDMCPGGVPLAINLSQYDSDVQLVFELFASRGSFVIESGTTVAIRGTKPDGNGIDLDAAISDNVVTVSVTQQMTAVAGTSRYELTLYKGEKELNTANFRLIIERAALDKDTLISGSEIRELVDIIDRTDEIIQAATDIQQTAEDLQEYVDAKEAEISQITTDAEETAQEALDEVTNVKNELNTITDSAYDASIWQQGAINVATGADAASVSRIRSSRLSKKIFGITITSGYYAVICVYDGDVYKGWWTGTGFSTAASGASKFMGSVSLTPLDAYDVRLYVISDNGVSINPIDDYQCVAFKKYTDNTLTRTGIPADAKATGDKIQSVADTSGARISVFETIAKNADEYPNLARLRALNTSGVWNDNAYTYNGITYTVNADLTITVSGTASNNSSFRIHSFNYASDTDLTLINPSFDNGDSVYVCRIAGNGAIQKYPKGVTMQTVPSGLQRILIRVENGTTVSAATTGQIFMLEGAINEYLLKADEKTKKLDTNNYIPYQRYSYSEEILNPTQLKTAYSADNLLEAIYAFCDDLVTSYPNFVTKETLQYTGNIVSSVAGLPDVSTVSDGDIYMVEVEGGYHQYICDSGAWVQMHTWNDDGDPINLVKLTYPMYAYTISPYSGCNYPVILWCSGLHGSEDRSNVSTLYLFKELLANRGQNDDIDYLLSNFVIKIIPCCGVSACADRTLGEHAMSENGINPNRDFPVDWGESQDEWRRTGNYPWYDPYNRIIKSFIEGLPNVLYCVNKHDSNSITSDAYVNNLWDNFISAHVVEDKIMKQLDLTIKAKYTWLLSEFVGTGVTWDPNEMALCNARYVYGGTYGTLEKWFNSIGIKGSLIETTCKTGAAYSDAGHEADFYRIALECDVMTLCAIAKNIKTLAISDEIYTTF